jgi:RNA polymerase sigma-70 factor (ECF subfamily)
MSSPVLTIKEYETLFRRHYRYLCLVAFGVVKDQGAAEDIVQDFFLSLWQRRSEMPFIISFQGYASRAVKNLSISHLRKQQPLLDEPPDLVADESDPLAEREMLVAGEAITARVMELVDLLPAERKKIFLLYVVDRLSYAQIAERNDISLNTVKTQMKKAYAFIRAKIPRDHLGVILVSIWFHQF